LRVLYVALQIPLAIAEWHAVPLQKTMNFIPRAQIKQAPNLRFGEPAGTIGFNRKALKGCPRKIGFDGFEMSSDILRQVERNLHSFLYYKAREDSQNALRVL
jgi:hypothetical protein